MTGVPAPGGSGRSGWAITRNVLRGVFGAALVVLVVLIVLRFTGAPGSVLAGETPTPSASSTPTPTPTPSATPTPTPSITPPPVSGGGTGGGGGGGGNTYTGPQFTDFSFTDAVQCAAPAAPPSTDAPFQPENPAETYPIFIEWRSTGDIAEAWIGANTSDAQLEPYTAVEPNGSFETSFYCPDREISWTVTLVGSDGTKVSKTARTVNTGYTG